jgi:hypothetical protein
MISIKLDKQQDKSSFRISYTVNQNEWLYNDKSWFEKKASLVEQ